MKTNSFSITRAAWFASLLAGTVLFCCLSPASAATGRIYLITSNPALETGTNSFAAFLQGLGYTVTVMQDPGVSPYERLDTIGSTNQALQAELVAELTTNYDLIIIHRNYGSGTLASSAEEIALWNNLNVPILLCNAPIARNNRWRWVNTAQSGAIASPKAITLLDTTHPIVAGLNPDLFAVENVPYGGVFNLDSSLPDGGPHAQALARANVIYAPLCLAVWDESGGTPRPFYDGSGQTYVRRRVFFEMQEYRNPGVPAWEGVSWNGRRLWANVVAYAMTGTVPPEPPAIGEFSPADGTVYNAGASSFSFQTASTAAIADENIRVWINGQEVSAQLEITGSATARAVTYQGLEPNRLYNVTITVSNQTGLGSAQVQFATFDDVFVQTFSPAPDNSFTVPAVSNVYQLFLAVQSPAAQILPLSQINASEQPSVARLKGVFALPGNVSRPRLFPLTDALDQWRPLRLPEDWVTFTLGTGSELSVQALYLLPLETPPATIPPALALASPHPDQGGVSVSATLQLQLVDGDSAVAPASVRLFLDGADVTAAPGTTVSDTDSGVEVTHSPSTFLASSQSHVVRVLYGIEAGPSYTNEYSFRTEQMPALPPELALPVDAGAVRGFNLRLHMAPGNPDLVFTNTPARAELQLAGLLVGPSGPVTNGINGTTLPEAYAENAVLNYSQDGTAQGQIGNDLLFPFGDRVLASQMAVEATAYLKLPAGIITLGVASDDGFKLTAGHDTNLVLGRYDGTRGAQVPTEFRVLVYREGLYPVRLLYYDGGGFASLEFYTVGPAGKALVNGTDPESFVPVPAYRLLRPRLQIALLVDQIELSWDGPGTFELQQTDQLESGLWIPVSQPPTVQGLRHLVTLPRPSNGLKFFRLQMQP